MTKLLSLDISRILAYGFAVMAIVGLFLIGPHDYLFFNLPALLIIAVPTLGLMYFRFGFAAFLFVRHQESRRLHFINQWERAFWHALGIATIICIIQMLANTSEPKNLGPPLAVILLSFLYMLIIRFFILEPLRDYSPVAAKPFAKVSEPRPKLILIAKTVVATIALQFILFIGALSFDEVILEPKRSAQRQQEREMENKKWETVTEKTKADLGVQITPEEVESLYYFLKAEEYSNFELINRVYTSKEINRESLFSYLRKLEVDE